jgi:uncharacterized protein (UPF0276 family)
MIQVGIRITPPLVPLLEVEGLVDYVLLDLGHRQPWSLAKKTWARQLRKRLPICIHAFDSLCSIDAFDSTALDCIEEAVEVSRASWFSEHIGFTVPHGQMAITFASPLTAEAIEAMSANASLLCEYLRIPVLLEDLGRPIAWPWDIVSEVEAIQQLLRKTQCDLLLDLSQASTTAVARGLTTVDYLHLLPLDRVREIHIEPTLEYGQSWQNEFDILELILPLTSAQAITIERLPNAGDDSRHYLQRVRKLCTT